MRTTILSFLLVVFFFKSTGAQVISAEPLPFPPFSKWADFDNDGKLDLISLANDRLKVFRVNGFSINLHDEVSTIGAAFNPIDIDGDGFPEIMTHTPFYLYYYPNHKGDLLPGKIHIESSIAGPTFIGHHVHDLDNDGDTDVLLLEDDGRFYFVENVNGELQPDEKVEIANLNTDGGSQVQFCDYNQDGSMDIIVRQAYKGIYLFLNTGHKKYFIRKLNSFSIQDQFAITDFDLDGYPDIVIGTDTPFSGEANGSILVWMNEASKGAPIYSLSGLYYPQSIEARNLDDDPEPEILIADDQSLSVVDLVNGNLVIEPIWGTPDKLYPTLYTVIEVGDYDHNGKLDVLHMVHSAESSLLRTEFNTPTEPPYTCDQFIDTLLCPSGDIYIANQEELNEFRINFPYCTHLNGSLFVQGGITDIGGISHIRSVRGSLVIENTHLDTIDDLEIVTVRENFQIHNNPALVHLDLKEIHFIHGQLDIKDNSALLKISGGDKIEQLSSVEIANNPLLKLVNGFSKVRFVSPIKFVDNPSLDSMNGFGDVIEGSIYFDNSPIEYMNSFSLSDTIVIRNAAYSDLKPFRWIRPDYLRLENIDQLSQITHLSQGPNDRVSLSIRNCDDLVKIELPLKIRHLELTDNDLIEDISAFKMANTIATDIIIRNNPRLPNLEGVQFPSKLTGKILIDDNAALSSIHALIVGDSGPIDSFSITNNPNLKICHIPLICDLLWGSVPHTISGNDEGCLNAPAVQAICGITTDENRPVVEDGIFVYPNPATDVLHVDAPSIPSQLIVLSANGKEIFRKDNSHQVSLPDLSPGIYFLKVITKDKTIFHTFSIAH